MVKRFREAGTAGLRFKSRKPCNSPSKTPNDIEKKIIEVRKATDFGGSEQLANIINESLNVVQQHRYDQKYRISKTTTAYYNILTRHSLVDSEKKIIKEYKSFERDKKPDELLQADLTR